MLNKAGFTMVELLVATLIISIGLLGYTSNQMKSIFDTSFSTKMSYSTMLSSDFISIIQNEINQKSTTTEKEDLLTLYSTTDVWTSETYSSELLDCESNTDLDDLLLCDESKRVDYNIMRFKASVQNEINDATFSFFTCASGLNCLTIAWNSSSNEELRCKSNISSCVLLEF